MIKQFYFKQFNLAYLNKVRWFQVLQCIINNSMKYQTFVYTQLNDQTVLFLPIQFSISHLFVHRLNGCQLYLTHSLTLSGANTPGQSEPRSDGNEGVLRIPQCSRIFQHIQDTRWSSLNTLQRYSLYILQRQPTGSITQSNLCLFIWF